jgi:uncharacterized protein YegP (UPF0339 family)
MAVEEQQSTGEQHQPMVFQVYEDSASEFRWRLVAGNNRTVADSGEGYDSRSNAHRAVEDVQSSAPRASLKDE